MFSLPSKFNQNTAQTNSNDSGGSYYRLETSGFSIAFTERNNHKYNGCSLSLPMHSCRIYIYISYIHAFTGAKSGSQTKHISLALTKWYRFFLGGNMAILNKVGRASLLLVLANKWSFVRFAFIIAGSLIVFYIVFDT